MASPMSATASRGLSARWEAPSGSGIEGASYLRRARSELSSQSHEAELACHATLTLVDQQGIDQSMLPSLLRGVCSHVHSPIRIMSITDFIVFVFLLWGK